jgi:hypothetical protein
MKIRILSLIFVVFVLTGCESFFSGDVLPSPGSAPVAPEWASYKKNQINLLYTPDINLRRLEARLRTRYFSVSAVERDLFSNPAYSVEDRILARLESILLRVEQILGMDPPYMDIKVKVFRNRRELSQEYFGLFGAVQNYKSFYINSQDTIYTSMQDVSDSEMSHEMAHAIIDNYFKVMPPEKTAELLATYVDSHLEEE